MLICTKEILTVLVNAIECKRGLCCRECEKGREIGS